MFLRREKSSPMSGLIPLSARREKPQVCLVLAAPHPDKTRSPKVWPQRLIFPALMQGGCSQSISTEIHYLNSLSYDIRKIIHVMTTMGLCIIIRYPSRKIFEKTSTKNWITVSIMLPITLLPSRTIANTKISPNCSMISMPRRTNSGASA